MMGEGPSDSDPDVSMLGEHLKRLPLPIAAMESAEVAHIRVTESAPDIAPEHQAPCIKFSRQNLNQPLERRGRGSSLPNGTSESA